MSAFRREKENVVAEIKSNLQAASSMFIAEYRGLHVSELETLRKELKAQGIKAKVYKNRLFKIAADSLGYESLATDLTGPNIFIFGSEADAIAPAKTLAKFAKSNKVVVIKGGIYENKVVDANEAKVIASLPSYEEALTMLASSLMGPLRQVSIGLKMLVDENKLPSEEGEK